MATHNRLAARASFRQDFDRARGELIDVMVELRSILIRKRAGEVCIHDGRRYGATGEPIDRAIKTAWSMVKMRRRWYVQKRRLWWGSKL